MITRLSIFRACLATAIVAPHLVSAAAVTETREVAVTYKKVDLGYGNASAELYSRLGRAANDVCSPLDGSGPRHQMYWNCKREALNKAVSDVNHHSVTALHERLAR